ncbi:D-amino acid dehydrogenase [Oleispirillum naphthae]|uniref:D-amino acid dehydrogenase n=1 Tax=Oleispirillum naphthae TaxID=2838853 RepID=UPI003082204F
MRAIVLGAGVVGVGTAYALARRGADVLVIDRQPAPALETSFANGGQISACHVTPWATPNTPHQLAKWFGRPDAPLYLPFWKPDLDLWRWGILFLANTSMTRSCRNMERALRVALHSRNTIKAWRAETGLHYDERTCGILNFYRDPREFEAACRANAAMNAHGLDRTVKTPDECIALEPALEHARKRIIGGIYSPSDESGDAMMFAQGLAKEAEKLGVRFRFDTSVAGLEAAGKTLKAVVLEGGERLTCDAAVVCLGSFSGKLTKSVGFGLPIYPAKGYSITVSTEGRSGAPTVSLIDDENKMVFSRLGERLRAAGTAELNGWSDAIDQRRADVILAKTRDLFPEAADYAEPNFWAGLRPSTPDSAPIIGATPVSGLWLNTGHGTLGWTMAAGSGDVIADCVTGETPAIDIDGLGMDRFGR